MRVLEVAEGIRGLIFDCDGTLADTMPYHIEAARRLDVEPGTCQVFEDGEIGLEAA